MINVLQICNKAPYPANDGSSIAIYNMALGLMENAINLHLLAINTKKHFKNDAEMPVVLKNKLHYQSVYKNTNTNLLSAFVNLFSSQSYFVSRFYFNDFETVLINTLKKNKFDIVQLEGVFMAIYLPIIRKHSNAKIVLRAHNIENLIWERLITNETHFFKKQYLKLQNKRLKKFEENTFKLVDAIVTITDVDKAYLMAMNFNKPIFTCITGVNVADYTKSTSVTKIPETLFYFGSMDWLPNQQAVEWFLNNCWDTILKQNPACKFIIAGRYMPKKFKTITKPNVLIIENVNNITEFYSKYDIMLVPLLSGSGLRIKIIEGLSFGKAIVTTSIGKEGIPVKNNQEIIIADSAENFITAVNSLLKTPHLKEQIEINAKDFALQNLNNKTITQQLANYYKTLTNYK